MHRLVLNVLLHYQEPQISLCFKILLKINLEVSVELLCLLIDYLWTEVCPFALYCKCLQMCCSHAHQKHLYLVLYALLVYVI